MKWKIMAALPLVPAVLLAQKINLAEYKEESAKNTEYEIIYTENFNTSAPGWILPAGGRLEKGSGIKESGALRLERTERNFKNYQTAVAKYPVKLVPGNSYRLTAWYRTEDLKVRLHMNFSASIQLYRDGRDAGILSPKPQPEESAQWKKTQLEFVATPDDAEIQLRLFYETSGSVYWDDVTLEEKRTGEYSVNLLKPQLLSLNDCGTLRFKIFGRGRLEHCLAYLRCGSREMSAPIKDREVSFELGKLPAGKYQAEFYLLHPETKTIVYRCRFELFRNAMAPLPETVSIDDHNRVVIDGKPVLPVGIFTTFLRTEADLKRIAAGGFNFILNYSTRSLNIQEQENEISRQDIWSVADYGTPAWEKRVRRSLDLVWKHKLKYISTDPRCFDRDVGGSGKTFQPVFRHPAVLAHYLADELINDKAMDQVNRTRINLAASDPYHPSVSLTALPQLSQRNAGIADVLGIDPYPIEGKNSRSILPAREFLIEAAKTKAPVMYVPQAFNWGAHKPKENYSDFRYPTETEMRSMVLLGAIYGAKWFCFYSYTTIMERQEKFDPGSSKMFWPRVCAVAKLLRGLEPWLLSLEKAPDVAIASKASSIVDARAFSSDGKLRVLVTACGPGKAEAVITVPGKANLKSRFGNIRPLGGGKYLFCGDDICSDILME